ncbi:hypothetical protein AKJ45_02590 [candidate division MSBL1 archaeon SCGC-AAA261F19]|uniref:Histidine kinase n=1 Tax=candidate division MSBL1 archaeon SCGC-AAA261F19 TaxID=1698275 RepID=A0A133V9N0_9EURY|nr:hypothetical protein AKJ45_02590 [candidate division MSBL1 archaeon SCGC-AAA261F19]
MKVLFVDDEPGILEQAKIFLRKADDRLEIETSLSAEDALDLLDKNNYDCIVTDYQMPEMDGLEFLKVVREDRDNDVPFIIFTGKGREEVAIDALNLGADFYLQKGGDPKSQYGVLARAIVQEVKRKEAEEELNKRSEAMEASMDGMAVLDENEEYVYVNDAHARIYGYDGPEELLGKSWKVLYGEEELERFENEIMPQFREEGGWRGEAVGKKKDGARFPQEVSLTALEDGGIICVVRDITERKKAEEKYTFESNLLNSLLNNSEDLVYFKDTEDRYVRVSKAYADSLGLDQEDMKGKTVFDLFPEEEAREMHEDDLEVMKEGKEVVDREHKITLSDGETRWLSTTKVPRYDDEGNVIGMIGISRDITERKRRRKNSKRLAEPSMHLGILL